MLQVLNKYTLDGFESNPCTDFINEQTGGLGIKEPGSRSYNSLCRTQSMKSHPPLSSHKAEPSFCTKLSFYGGALASISDHFPLDRTVFR